MNTIELLEVSLFLANYLMVRFWITAVGGLFVPYGAWQLRDILLRSIDRRSWSWKTVRLATTAVFALSWTLPIYGRVVYGILEMSAIERIIDPLTTEVIGAQLATLAVTSILALIECSALMQMTVGERHFERAWKARNVIRTTVKIDAFFLLVIIVATLV